MQDKKTKMLIHCTEDAMCEHTDLFTGQVKSVLQKAVQRYPRIGSLNVSSKDCTLVLKSWSNSKRNQILFHNDILQCGRVSLRQVSERRGLYNEEQRSTSVQPGERGHSAAAPAPSPSQSGLPAPPTPPGGRA